MRRTRARTVLAASIALAAASGAGCSSGLEQAWQLSSFRVLGLKADPPEPDRGAAFTLDLVSADTMPRDVQVLWLLCSRSVPPGAAGDAGTGGAGGAFSFAGGCPADAQQVAMGPHATFRVPAEGGTLDSTGGEQLSVVGFACAGGTLDFSALARPDAGPETISMVCRGTNAQSWLFTGAVPVHGPTSLDPTAPNHNPTISEVRLAGTALNDAAPMRVPRCADQSNNSMCPQYPFELAYAAGSREGYHTRNAVDGTITTDTERLTAGFVITGGRLEAAFRGDTRLAPESPMTNNWRAPDTAGSYRLVVWTLDGRGGFDSTSRTILVE